VARDDVLAQLRFAAEEAVTGRGELILLTGEAGIGKTTMLSEAARYAETRGMRVAWGFCAPDDTAPASASLAEAAAARLLTPVDRAAAVPRTGAAAPEAQAFRFAHDLFREHAYQRLNTQDRARLHGRAGAVLAARRAAGADVPLAELAGHFSQADPHSTDAFRYCAAAAREAAGQLAYEEAARHWEAALTAVSAAPPGPVLTSTLLDLAEARGRAGNLTAAGEAFRRAAGLARGQHDAAALARAALGLQAIGTRAWWPPDEIITLLTEALTALPDSPEAAGRGGALRARVMAGLARVLAWHQIDLPRAAGLADGAVAAARAAGDARLVAGCLIAQHNAHWQPGNPADRRAIAEAAAGCAREAGDQELLAEARLLIATDLLELADPAFRAGLSGFGDLAGTAPDPRLRYAALARRAMLTLVGGQFAEAERLISDAAAAGRDCGDPGADDVRVDQGWDLLRLRSSYHLARTWLALGDDPTPPAPGTAGPPTASPAEPREAPGRLPASPAAPREIAGSPPAGSAALRDAAAPALASAAVPRGTPGSPPASSVASRDAAGSPPAGPAAPCETGSRYATPPPGPGRRAAALELLAGTAAAARVLGLGTLADAAEAAAHAAGARPATVGRFARDGGLWTLSYAGATVRMRHAKGLSDLATLLSHPGQPVSAADLIAAPDAGGQALAGLRLGADEVLDANARQQIRTRLDDLAEEVAEAEDWADPERAARARAERDTLLHELTTAAGLAGRQRLLGDQGERARKTVTARIRDVISRIERVHPALGSHLRATVTTGTSCAYSPPAPVTWDLRPRS
jgi:tetratricopeptide (TPR) repeat protein